MRPDGRAFRRVPSASLPTSAKDRWGLAGIRLLGTSGYRFPHGLDSSALEKNLSRSCGCCGCLGMDFFTTATPLGGTSHAQRSRNRRGADGHPRPAPRMGSVYHQPIRVGHFVALPQLRVFLGLQSMFPILERCVEIAAPARQVWQFLLGV